MERASRGVRIVLVRARNPLNIGAAARAMANFGFDDLVVVRPHAPVWREARSAVGAEAVVRSARAAAGGAGRPRLGSRPNAFARTRLRACGTPARPGRVSQAQKPRGYSFEATPLAPRPRAQQ